MPQQLKAGPIQTRTKGDVKRLRRQGFIPISIQHRGQETLHLQEEAHPLEEFIHRHGEASLLELVVEPDNRRHTVLVHDVQRDPISRRLLHVTFQEVVRGEPIKVHVPLLFHGEPEAVREHTAVVQHAADTLEIRCLPQDLLEHITVEISQVQPGDVLRVSDLPPTDRYEILTQPDTVLVSLVRPQVAAEEEAETVEEPLLPSEEEAPQ